MSKSTAIICIVLTLLIAGGGGFYGGMTYQKGKQPQLPGGGTFTRGNFNVNGRARGVGFPGGGNAVRGEITATDGSTMTVKATDGSSKIVLVTSSTTFEKNTTAAASEVQVGSEIMATGTANSDGSVTASSIQLNPTQIVGGGQTPPGL